MFTPGIKEIADDFGVDVQPIISTSTGFVISLGIGPLIIAPLSETFGRKKLYISCFGTFALLQIPTALSPNVAFLIAARTISGFFGSVGIANGGGTLSDMFEPSQRAGVFGWYLLGPLLGPTLGPLFGGIIVKRLGWRWIYWILAVVCVVNVSIGYFFLRETYAPILLGWRKADLERKEGVEGTKKYRFEGEDERSMGRKILNSFKRPLKILSHPIVLTMSLYQALIFGTTYSIYTNMQEIYGRDYGFDTEQVGLLFLGPGLGFLAAVWFLVPRIDTVYNKLSKHHGGRRPEFRLPLANVGAVLIPLSLFWFAWTVQYHVHWAASITATFFYGIGQVMVLNTVQNYYIDAFERYAASAIAGGALFRSIVGGVVPLVAPSLFHKLGYGWGISVFGFISLLLAPAPLVFYKYGERIREKFVVDL